MPDFFARLQQSRVSLLLLEVFDCSRGFLDSVIHIHLIEFQAGRIPTVGPAVRIDWIHFLLLPISWNSHAKTDIHSPPVVFRWWKNRGAESVRLSVHVYGDSGRSRGRIFNHHEVEGVEQHGDCLPAVPSARSISLQPESRRRQQRVKRKIYSCLSSEHS